MWSFRTDDFGIIWHSQINSWHDIIKFFTGRGTLSIVQPSNFRPLPQDFFSVFYRPMSYIFYAIQTFFFNFSPYPYFGVKIFFHSLNTVLLQHLFFLFTRNQLVAFFAALLFAFHSTLAGPSGIGWITLETHTINLTLLFFCIIALKKYLDLTKGSFLFLSLLTFNISLFHIETGLFLPLIIVIGVYFYTNNKNVSIKTGTLFFLSSLFYLGTRFAIYSTQESGAGYSFLDRINPLMFLKTRFFDIINLCCDLAFIPWLGEGHTSIKVSVLSIFAISVITTFVLSKRKNLQLFLFFAFIVMLWPALIRYYTTRYLYTALPLFIAFFLAALKYNTIKVSSFLKKIIFVFTSLFIIANGFYVIASLRTQSQESMVLHNAFQKLKDHPEILNKNLCFIGLPIKWFRTGITQAVWMQGINKKYPVYYDQQTTIHDYESPFQLHIVPITDGFRLAIINGANAHFWNFKDSALYMGSSTIHRKLQDNNAVVDISYILDKEWLDKKPFFITWDYEKNLFKIIGNVVQNKESTQ
jgi:hypothetical protein